MAISVRSGRILDPFWDQVLGDQPPNREKVIFPRIIQVGPTDDSDTLSSQRGFDVGYRGHVTSLGTNLSAVIDIVGVAMTGHSWQQY